MFFALLRKKPVIGSPSPAWPGCAACQRRSYFLKKSGGDHVHALVGALRGKDGGDGELERIGEHELAAGVGIGRAEAGEDIGGAFLWSQPLHSPLLG